MHRYRNTYPTCIDLISSGAVDVKKIITHRFDLSREFTAAAVKDGFNAASNPKAVKVMFQL
jgi:L-iditol 2-dehydrogenase